MVAVGFNSDLRLGAICSAVMKRLLRVLPRLSRKVLRLIYNVCHEHKWGE